MVKKGGIIAIVAALAIGAGAFILSRKGSSSAPYHIVATRSTSSIPVTGTNFSPNASVTIYVNGQPDGNAPTNGAGSFNWTQPAIDGLYNPHPGTETIQVLDNKTGFKSNSVLV